MTRTLNNPQCSLSKKCANIITNAGEENMMVATSPAGSLLKPTYECKYFLYICAFIFIRTKIFLTGKEFFSNP